MGWGGCLKVNAGGVKGSEGGIIAWQCSGWPRLELNSQQAEQLTTEPT